MRTLDYQNFTSYRDKEFRFEYSAEGNGTFPSNIFFAQFPYLLPVIAESVYYDNLCNKCLPKFIKLLQLACLSVAGCRVIFSMLVMRSELELMEFSVKQNISIQATLQMSPR
jgi:hypothetical protein